MDRRSTKTPSIFSSATLCLLACGGVLACTARRSLGYQPLYGKSPFAYLCRMVHGSPVAPLTWSFVGLRAGEGDQPDASGALKRSWPTHPTNTLLRHLSIIIALSVVGSSLTLLGWGVLMPSWHQGSLSLVAREWLDAGCMLASVFALFFSWGRAAGAWLGSVWGGIVALGIPLIAVVFSTMKLSGDVPGSSIWSFLAVIRWATSSIAETTYGDSDRTSPFFGSPWA